MTLSASSTANDIVTAVEGELGVTLDADAKALWTAIVGALYTRIKADILISSTVAAPIPGVVNTGVGAGGITATTAPGTATSSSVT